MNKIDNHRQVVLECLSQGKLLEEEASSETSPDGRFEVKIAVFSGRPDRDYGEYCVAKVQETHSGEDIAVLYRNDDRFWHAWVSRDGRDFLVCSESLEGQTVVDLTNRQVASVTCDEDLFIWTDFHLSTDSSMLAVVGCYWACPYVVKVYDFRDPMSLPLPLPTVTEFTLPRNDATFERWIDSRSFRVLSPDGTNTVFEIPNVLNVRQI